MHIIFPQNPSPHTYTQTYSNLRNIKSKHIEVAMDKFNQFNDLNFKILCIHRRKKQIPHCFWNKLSYKLSLNEFREVFFKLYEMKKIYKQK